MPVEPILGNRDPRYEVDNNIGASSQGDINAAPSNQDARDTGVLNQDEPLSQGSPLNHPSTTAQSAAIVVTISTTVKSSELEIWSLQICSFQRNSSS